MKNLPGPAFIFPAFISEFPEDPFGDLKLLESRFSEYLRIAATLADPGLASFVSGPGCIPTDELKVQYLTYIFSCAASDVLGSMNIRPAFTAGYSMGIYAALVNAGVIGFGDGLKLIGKAYETIRHVLDQCGYTMCSVIGLSKEDIENIIGRGSLEAAVVNRNSPFAFVLSGKSADIHTFSELAKEEGALNVHHLNVTIPYHSDFLRKTEKEFSDFLETAGICKPETGIISLINQRVLFDEASVRKEIVRNLYSPLNWYETQKRLMELGVGLFIECGPGKSLVKNSKFIDGDYRFIPLSAYIKELSRF